MNYNHNWLSNLLKVFQIPFSNKHFTDNVKWISKQFSRNHHLFSQVFPQGKCLFRTLCDNDIVHNGTTAALHLSQSALCRLCSAPRDTQIHISWQWAHYGLLLTVRGPNSPFITFQMQSQFGDRFEVTLQMRRLYVTICWQFITAVSSMHHGVYIRDYLYTVRACPFVTYFSIHVLYPV